jgi:hypothetical protein
VGFVVTSVDRGAGGHNFYDISREPRDRARASRSTLVLESNHDDEMLRNGPYGPKRKRGSRRGSGT